MCLQSLHLTTPCIIFRFSLFIYITDELATHMIKMGWFECGSSNNRVNVNPASLLTVFWGDGLHDYGQRHSILPQP